MVAIWKLKIALKSSPLPVSVRVLYDKLVGMYLRIKMTDQDRNRTRTNNHHHLTIDEVSDSDCRARYLFTKEQLHRLHKALRLDRFPIVEMANGSKFGSEEVLLIGLHRFVFPQRFFDMTAIYGRDWSALTRAFNWFCKYMRINFSYLIYDNCEYWKPEFEYFTECVRKKVEEKSDGNIQFDPGSYCVFGFVDDTVIKTTRPGGGPCEDGPNAARYNTLIQMAFYSGFKKHHGIKFQTLELPNGLCMDAFGPCSFRQNDLEVLGLSDLNNRLKVVPRGPYFAPRRPFSAVRYEKLQSKRYEPQDSSHTRCPNLVRTKISLQFERILPKYLPIIFRARFASHTV
jgi:hypothetical protein